MAASIPYSRSEMTVHVLQRAISGDITEYSESVFAHCVKVPAFLTLFVARGELRIVDVEKIACHMALR
jgi:hypothetical protein